ncbi:glutaminase [Acanthamoeba castellanii str. Neff]|uniref:glutaminase n=1 Tax=Acanthamoeba castellanii (strain ATCC 30010 / Neff) TaxID=1257118 RepID=L8GVS3_ACACF|nr:glutaminase [Acanthamoeba castellanii str. Neff]ELR17042.1 glutaminase [Acanthamoeba castellanii str. Neff]
MKKNAKLTRTYSTFRDAKLANRLKDEELKSIFDSLDKSNQGFITTNLLKKVLVDEGLGKGIVKKAVDTLDQDKDDKIFAADFLRLKEMKTDIIERALTGRVAIPDWADFINNLKEIYEHCEALETGQNAQYIPQLARVNSNQFGIAVQTVDGQIWTHGDADVPFTLQSCSKPITYCIAEGDRGEEKMMRHVGHEPSGRKFNAFELDERNPAEKKPFNPMINAGAIVTASLLKPDYEPADRFGYVQTVWQRLSDRGDGQPTTIGFDNATYLSELRHADRNFALSYFMKGEGVFDKSVNSDERVRAHLEFYLQLCSMTGTTRDMASVASALANGGTNPITKEKIFPAACVRNCLSIMFSCGMYDYSGEFAYSVGLPAKSGVSGCVMVVVPNLLGMCIWSPRIDDQGNSVRAVEFCKQLTSRYAFHVFDDVISCSEGSQKKNPRLRQATNKEINVISEFIFAAANGNLTRVMELVLAGTSVNVADYDGRAALHLAAAEGRLKVAEYLVNKGANVLVRDRWGATPFDEAVRAGHKDLAALLERAGNERKAAPDSAPESDVVTPIADGHSPRLVETA